jgi:8-oxo-dGTP diphosphatase
VSGDLYLVRHAAALSRSGWSDPDHLRPLSDAGIRQARALPRHLGDVPFARLFTSPFVRCVQTLEPLAETEGSLLELVDWLAEGSSAGAALERLLPLVSEGAVAACTHGDVLLDTLACLGAAGVPLAGPRESTKGSTWLLEVRDGSVAHGRYLGAPAALGAPGARGP